MIYLETDLASLRFMSWLIKIERQHMIHRTVIFFWNFDKLAKLALLILLAASFLYFLYRLYSQIWLVTCKSRIKNCYYIYCKLKVSQMKTNEKLSVVYYDENNLCECRNWDGKYDLYIPQHKETNAFSIEVSLIRVYICQFIFYMIILISSLNFCRLLVSVLD